MKPIYALGFLESSSHSDWSTNILLLLWVLKYSKVWNRHDIVLINKNNSVKNSKGCVILWRQEFAVINFTFVDGIYPLKWISEHFSALNWGWSQSRNKDNWPHPKEDTRVVSGDTEHMEELRELGMIIIQIRRWMVIFLLSTAAGEGGEKMKPVWRDAWW